MFVHTKCDKLHFTIYRCSYQLFLFCCSGNYIEKWEQYNKNIQEKLYIAQRNS